MGDLELGIAAEAGIRERLHLGMLSSEVSDQIGPFMSDG